MSAVRHARAVSVSTAGYEDGLGRRSVRFDREIGGMLECLQLRPELWTFEGALRQRADAIASLEDERFVRIRGIERGPHGLVVVSELVPGGRLSDILEARQNDDAAGFGIDAALGFLLRVLPALSALHSASIAHGALAAGRIVVTPAAQIVLLDGIYGAALERLNLSRAALWSSLGVLSLPFAGASRFDRRSDVMQAALCAVTLALGRQIDDVPTQASLSALVREVTELAQIRAGNRFSQGVQEFLTATLPVTGRAPDMATDAAVTFVERLAGLIGEDEAHAAFETLTGYESPSSSTFETEDGLFDDDSDVVELEADAVSASLDGQDAESAAFDDEDDQADEEPLEETSSKASAVPVPSPPPAVPAAAVETRPTAAPLPVVPSTPVVAAPPAPPPPPAVMPLTPVVPATASSPVPVQTVPTPYVPPIVPVMAPPIAVAPPPIPAVAPTPLSVLPPPVATLPVLQAPVASAPSPPPIAITVAPPAPVRVRAEPPTGFSPSVAPDVAPPVRALPFVDRVPVEEPRTFPWKIAAAAIVVLAIGFAGWTYFPGSTEMSRNETAEVTEQAAPVSAPTPTSGKLGSLSIDSQPAGAKVLVDGKEVGVTPLTLDAVQPGRRTITVTNGTATIRRTVRIEAGRSASLEVPIYSGWVAVFSPIPLDIATGGKTIGSTDTGKILLPPGKHVLTLSNREFGYLETRSVEIHPGEERPVNVEPKGRINVNAHPWAEVFVDGKKAGETPIANLPVLLGTRVITFRHPQFGERRITQMITAAGAALSVDLTRN